MINWLIGLGIWIGIGLVTAILIGLWDRFVAKEVSQTESERQLVFGVCVFAWPVAWILVIGGNIYRAWKFFILGIK